MLNSKIRSVLVGIVVVGAATILRVLMTGRVSFTGIDDANIYFTYVKNFLANQSIAFVSGGEPVEGFTSLLWFGLLAGGQALSPFSLDTTSLVLSTCIAVAFLAVVYHVVEQQSPRLGLSIVVLVAFLPGGADWLVLSRMETGIWAFIVCLAVVETTVNTINRNRLVVLLSLLPLVRPEGYALAPILALVAAFRHSYSFEAFTSGEPRKKFFGLFAYYIAGPLIVIASIIAWRLASFGVPLPMTYYAKVSASFSDNVLDGAAYLVRTLSHGGWVVFLGFLYLAYARKNRHQYELLILTLGWLFLQPVLSGGDHFAYGRFFFPAFALSWIAISLMIDSSRFSNKKLIVATVFLVAAQQFVTTTTPFGNNLMHEYKIAADGRLEAELIESVHGTGNGSLPVWGVTSAGGTSYAYDGTCLDLLGLNNPMMAFAKPYKRGVIRNHASFAAEVFFEQQPDVLVVFGAPSLEAAIEQANADWALGGIQRSLLQDLVDDPRFSDLYTFTAIGRNETTYYAIARRAWLAGLPEDVSVVELQNLSFQAPDMP